MERMRVREQLTRFFPFLLFNYDQNYFWFFIKFACTSLQLNIFEKCQSWNVKKQNVKIYYYKEKCQNVKIALNTNLS